MMVDVEKAGSFPGVGRALLRALCERYNEIVRARFRAA